MSRPGCIVVNSYTASNPFNLALSLLDQSQWPGLTSWATSEQTGMGGEGLQTCTVYHGKARCDIASDLVKPKQQQFTLALTVAVAY